MEVKKLMIMLVTGLLAASVSHAQLAPVSEQTSVQISAQTQESSIEELNPFDPNIEQILNDYDAEYERATGQSSHLAPSIFDILFDSGCSRFTCPVYLQVVKYTQTAYLYRNGQLTETWKVSTGAPGHGTPNFDRHPNGRIYDKYSSKTYPGGNYNGLGNMPYAVFIEGGFAVHGTPQSNWKNLGRRASHGCIRVHPDNGYTFNRLVREFGVSNVWITVQN